MGTNEEIMLHAHLINVAGGQLIRRTSIRRNLFVLMYVQIHHVIQSAFFRKEIFEYLTY